MCQIYLNIPSDNFGLIIFACTNIFECTFSLYTHVYPEQVERELSLSLNISSVNCVVARILLDILVALTISI